MKRTQKYLSSEAHGYLREAEACSLVLKDLERISAKLQRRIDKETAVAEDIAQNIFMKVWLNREKLDAAKSIRNYLFVLAKHEIYNYFRTKSRTFTTLKEAIAQTESKGGGETCLRGTRSRRSSIWRRLPSRSRSSSERCPRSGSRFSACRVSSTCRAGRSPNN